MRWLVLGSFGLGACSLYFTGSDSGSGSGSGPTGVQPVNTCGFYEGNDAIACTTPGATCEIETWEHGCSCSCGSDGWWNCFGETIGSTCPHSPIDIDAGIDAPPDAIPIDAAACSPIEAEAIGVHPGWSYLYGSDLSGGLGLITSTTTALVFDFTGTTLAVRHEIGPNESPMTFSIDSTPIVVAGYATTFSMTTTPVASGLANEVHHVTIVCGGNNCNVDDFDVECE
jgi:hypothetical protein